MALEPGVGEPPLLKRTQPEIVDENVGFFDQAGEDSLPRRNRHVERQRTLVAVDAEKIDRLAGHEGRTPLAGIVASIGRLDLDDLGAHVAEHHGAEGACQDASQIEHADPGERAILAHGHVLRMEGGALRSLAQPSR